MDFPEGSKYEGSKGVQIFPLEPFACLTRLSIPLNLLNKGGKEQG